MSDYYTTKTHNYCPLTPIKERDNDWWLDHRFTYEICGRYIYSELFFDRDALYCKLPLCVDVKAIRDMRPGDTITVSDSGDRFDINCEWNPFFVAKFCTEKLKEFL